MFVHQYPAQKRILFKAVTLIKLGLFPVFFKPKRKTGTDFADPDIREPQTISRVNDEDAMAAHGNGRFSPQVAGCGIRHLIAKLAQKPAEKSIQLKAETAFPLRHHLLKKVIFIYTDINDASGRYITVRMPAGGKIGDCQRSLRAQTMQGDRVALANSETVPKGSKLTFIICMTDKAYKPLIKEWLDYGRLRGLGQWRNSGKGAFTWKEV